MRLRFIKDQIEGRKERFRNIYSMTQNKQQPEEYMFKTFLIYL